MESCWGCSLGGWLRQGRAWLLVLRWLYCCRCDALRQKTPPVFFSTDLDSLWCLYLMKMSTFAGTISSEDWLLLSRTISPSLSLPFCSSKHPPSAVCWSFSNSSLSFCRLIFYLCCAGSWKLVLLSSEESGVCSARKADWAFSSVLAASGDERLLNSERLRLVSSCWQEVTFSCSVEERSSFSLSGGPAARAFSCLDGSFFLAPDLDLEGGLGAHAGLVREQSVSCELLGLIWPFKARFTFRLISSHDCPNYPDCCCSTGKLRVCCWSKSSSIIIYA